MNTEERHGKHTPQPIGGNWGMGGMRKGSESRQANQRSPVRHQGADKIKKNKGGE